MGAGIPIRRCLTVARGCLKLIKGGVQVYPKLGPDLVISFKERPNVPTCLLALSWNKRTLDPKFLLVLVKILGPNKELPITNIKQEKVRLLDLLV